MNRSGKMGERIGRESWLWGKKKKPNGGCGVLKSSGKREVKRGGSTKNWSSPFQKDTNGEGGWAEGRGLKCTQ